MTIDSVSDYLLKSLKYWAITSIVYVILILLLPANQATLEAYNLSAIGYKSILSIIAIPNILIWLAAFIGYAKLQEYASAINSSKEGKYFNNLSKGAQWLAWSLPLPTLISLILFSLANESGNFHTSAIIVSNWISVIVAIIAFTLISKATNGLANYAKIKYSVASSRLLIFCFVIIGVLYCFITFYKINVGNILDSQNQFFLPLWLIVATIVIPFLYAWFVGLLAAYEIILFSKNSKGVIYKQSLFYISFGLVIIICSLIAQQFLNSLFPRVWYLALDYRLILMMFFKVLSGLGFLLMALGAIKLIKIEEV